MPSTISPLAHASLHPQHARRARRPRYLPTRGRWNEDEPAGFHAGLKLSIAGLIFLAGFGLAALNDATTYAIPPFLIGSALLLTGSLVLLCTLGRTANSRLRRIRHHCGRCQFYQALEGQYTAGHCRAAPGEPGIRRTDGCPSFRYSERAMVRERLAQRPDLLKQVRITHVN